MIPVIIYKSHNMSNSLTSLQRKRCKKTEQLTNIRLFVCMSAGNSEMLVFLSVFSQQCAFFKFFNGRLGKKQKNVSFYGVCMYVRPKLTFVSFYFCFFCTFPLSRDESNLVMKVMIVKEVMKGDVSPVAMFFPSDH